MKNIIREIPACESDFSYYFDGDCFTSAGGEYGYNLFIVNKEGYGRINGFNIEEYKRIVKQADSILDGFSDVEDGITNYDGKAYSYKDIMQENDIPYNSMRCHKLKEWAEHADLSDTESIASLLTIITGKEWKVKGVSGYSQGDYVEVVYCTEFYSDVVKFGEIWMGCGKEFCVIDLDDSGNEIDSCYGYIVADCEAWKDEDYKRLVCEWACIDPTETALEMIENESVSYSYSYRTI